MTTSDVIPGGVFVAGGQSRYPGDILVESARGATITSTDGTEYVDYVLGGGPMVVGHANPHVVDAIQRQAERGTAYYLSSEPAFEFAERVVDAVPCAEQVHFTSTGSEATYFALRLARASTGNEKVLKFAGAYHGFHDFVMKSSTFADQEDLLAQEFPDGTHDSAGLVDGALEQTLVAPFNDSETTADIVREHAADLAAIIVEPQQRVLPPADGFLETLRELCDEHGIVLVFDEVVTGFRLAMGGAQELYGVEPDLATYGKAIGGGTPVGLIAGRERIMELSSPSRSPADGGAPVFGTLNGNPLSATAANAALDVLERPGTYDQLHDYADRLRALIEDVLADSPIDGLAMGDGPVVGYLLTDESHVGDWPTVLGADSETQRAIDERMLEYGVSQILGGKRYISTAHGDDEFARTAEAFKAAVEDVTG